MIVCSCNVLSDHDVCHAVNFADNFPRKTKQIYAALAAASNATAACARSRARRRFASSASAAPSLPALSDKYIAFLKPFIDSRQELTAAKYSFHLATSAAISRRIAN